MSKPIARLGFYSRKSAVLNIDRRSSEARLIRHVIAGLEDELGGPDKITFRQSLIIQSTADLVLRLQLAMGRYVRAADDEREIDKHVVTLQNAMVKNLKALDFAPVSEASPTLAEYLSAKAAVRVDDAA